MELKIQTRNILGKRVRGLRRIGLIPAEVYGHGIENEHVSVTTKEFSKIYKEAGENTIVNLITAGQEKIPVLVSHVSYAPLSGEILNVDFHRVKMDEKIQTKIPLEFTGDAPALKKGFLTMEITHELEIEALPNKLPHRIEINLETLKDLGQSIRVKNLKLSKEIKILTPEDTVIATVTEKAKEEIEEKPPETTETAETAKPENKEEKETAEVPAPEGGQDPDRSVGKTPEK